MLVLYLKEQCTANVMHLELIGHQQMLPWHPRMYCSNVLDKCDWGCTHNTFMEPQQSILFKEQIIQVHIYTELNFPLRAQLQCYLSFYDTVFKDKQNIFARNI